MNNQRSRIILISIAIILALLGSGVLYPPIQTRAASILPNMTVTLSSGDSTYASTVKSGNSLIFRAAVKNTGNVPLQVTANLAYPQGWDVDQEKFSDCPDNLAVRSTCTISWYFTPQATGQVYLRVYVRGFYTDSTGASNRITQSPAFIFNVVPSKGTPGSNGTSSSGTTSSSTPVPNPSPSTFPDMAVTLISGDSTYASTVKAGNSLIFRAAVKNIGNVPLQVTANLTYPQGWDVDQEKFSDCPDNLAVRSTCTISWYFTPQATGQVYLRVYVRGAYTTSSGASSRITKSPAFIFNVK